MKNLVKISLVVAVLATLSFTNVPKYTFTGTYGVSKNDPSEIRLILNEDHTFTYRDFSNARHKINTHGNWELKGRYVILKNADPGFSFHDKWTFNENGMVARSRKGVTFYTLNKCIN